MTPEEKYNLYLQNNPAGERPIEVITISSPDISQYFNICREPDGVTVSFDDGSTFVDVDGANISVDKGKANDDLDEIYNITIGDTLGAIQQEVDQIPLDSADPVVVSYRLYMNSDLEKPAIGPVNLQASAISFDIGKVTIQAKSPSLAVNRTGELLTYARFPMQT